MIGHRFMGRAHSHGWRVAPHVADLPRGVEMRLLVGRDDAGVRASAARLGWAQTCTSWQEAVARDDIDVIDIGAPSDVHAQIALAALAAGKHVLCEKPMANTLDQAREMACAAADAAGRGLVAMVGFTYRRVPAIRLAQRMIAAGDLGAVRHVRAVYLQDWLNDPAAPMSWRLDRTVAGSGALGDLGSHIVDAVQFLTSRHVTEVVATTTTFVTERPWPASVSGGSGGSGAGGAGGAGGVAVGRVTVDDAVTVLATLAGGATATFEASRVAAGRKNGLRLEVNGERGSLVFDLEDLNVLQHYDTADGAGAGFRRILVTEPTHPYVADWWPPGHGLGYDAAFVNQAADFVRAVAGGPEVRPSFADGLQIQQVLEAVAHSAATRTWQSIPPMSGKDLT